MIFSYLSECIISVFLVNADLHDALVDASEEEVEHLLSVSPDDVGEEVLPEPLHLQGQHLLGAQVGVARADHIPGSRVNIEQIRIGK